jgi:hypothetical protein
VVVQERRQGRQAACTSHHAISTHQASSASQQTSQGHHLAPWMHCLPELLLAQPGDLVQHAVNLTHRVHTRQMLGSKRMKSCLILRGSPCEGFLRVVHKILKELRRCSKSLVDALCFLIDQILVVVRGAISTSKARPTDGPGSCQRTDSPIEVASHPTKHTRPTAAHSPGQSTQPGSGHVHTAGTGHVFASSQTVTDLRDF